jgi:general secretion pathway protein E
VKFKGVGPEKWPPPGKLFRAREGGCPACVGLGYKGRTAIYELLIIDEKTRQLTIKNADAGTVKNHAMSAGMRTLRDDGAQKVLAGMTTTAEVLMITTQDVE